MTVHAFDTETHLISSAGRQCPRAVCVSWSTPERAGIDSPRDGAARVAEWLRDPEVEIVGHNLAYDVAVLLRVAPLLAHAIFAAYDADRMICTRVYALLADIGGVTPRGVLGSLAAQAAHYLGETMRGKHGPDAWRFRYAELDGVPPDEWPRPAFDYALTDAENTRKLREAQRAAFDLPDLHAQTRVDLALHLMGAWGVRVDRERVPRLAHRLRSAVAAVEDEIKASGILRADGTQDLALTRRMVADAYAATGRQPPTTDKGGVSYSTETLLDSGHPILVKWGKVQKDRKEIASFLPFLEEAAVTDMPICPRWNVLVRSGRTSCQKPNLQQLPKRFGVRECLVPRDGHLFIGADYSIAELRSLAQVLYWEIGRNRMLDALCAGLDLHLVTAAEILGVTYEEIARRYEAGDPAAKEARQLAKVVNFGLPGGLSAKTLIEYAAGDPYRITLTPERAKELVARWHAAYPEMRGYFDRRGQACAAGPTTIRQYGSGRLRADTGYTDGCNTYFQGLTADGAKRALWAVTREAWCDTSSPLYGFRCVVFVHDELILEGPADRAPEAADRLAAIMVAEMAAVCPDVPHLAEPWVAPRWSKKNKTIRDAAGRLVPCPAPPDEED